MFIANPMYDVVFSMTYNLPVVTGAPGSGKTTIVHYLLSIESKFVFLDMDWLADSASRLASRNIYIDPTTWRPYQDVWFDVLKSLFRNSLKPVLFTPNSPLDYQHNNFPKWVKSVDWLLLDCHTEVRKKRLAARDSWTESRIDEALFDADELRSLIGRSVDTSELTIAQTAESIVQWLNSLDSSLSQKEPG